MRQLAEVRPGDDDEWPLEVSWCDFRVQNGYTDQSEMIEVSAFGPFTFDGEAYRRALLEPVGVLAALAADEVVARREYQRTRGVRGVVRQLLAR